MVSHAPGAAVADHPLALPQARAAAAAPEDVARAAAGALQREADEPEIKAAAAAADGSVARALDLIGGTALAVRERVNAMLDALPVVDPAALHALGDALGRGDETAFAAFVDAVRDWLSARVTAARAEPRGSCALPTRGRSSIPRRAMSRSSISNESRLHSTCSAGLPRPRAVDT